MVALTLTTVSNTVISINFLLILLWRGFEWGGWSGWQTWLDGWMEGWIVDRLLNLDC
jgi:hypothetical protein